MTTIRLPLAASRGGGEFQAVGLVSAAHFVSLSIRCIAPLLSCF